MASVVNGIEAPYAAGLTWVPYPQPYEPFDPSHPTYNTLPYRHNDQNCWFSTITPTSPTRDTKTDQIMHGPVDASMRLLELLGPLFKPDTQVKAITRRQHAMLKRWETDWWMIYRQHLPVSYAHAIMMANRLMLKNRLTA